MSQVSLLLIGDTTAAEVHHLVDAMVSTLHVKQLRSVAEAIARLTEDDEPVDLIVLVQSWPDQHTTEEVDALRRLAPLTRIVSLLGSWCEGAARTGTPLPGIIRVYWHQWTAWFARQLQQVQQGECPEWGLPLTAGDDERLLFADAEPLAFCRGFVGICTQHVEMADWLAECCQMHGLATLWMQPARQLTAGGISAVIWDATAADPRQIAELRQLASAYAGVPILALLDFPRIEDQQRALAAGASAVISKPLSARDLFWHLDRVLGPPEPQPTVPSGHP